MKKLMLVVSLFLAMMMLVAVAVSEEQIEVLTDTAPEVEIVTQDVAEEPSQEPKAQPEVELTAEPTVVPTEEATEEITGEPAIEVEAEPTEEATAEPMTELTAEPTVETTAEASEAPTQVPVDESAEEGLTTSDTETVEPTLVVEERARFQITSPQKGQKVPVDHPLTVSWTPLAGADFYDVALQYEHWTDWLSWEYIVSGSQNSCTLDAEDIYFEPGSGSKLTIYVNAYSSDEEMIGSVSVTVKVTKGASINLSPTSAKLYVGQTLQLVPEIIPENASSALTYTSSNKNVATVSANGLVTAVKKGSATITAKTSNGKKATCKVTVVDAPKSVKLNKTTLTLAIQQSEKLKATLSKDSATTLNWESSDTNVATVSSDGTVTAVGVGETTISIKTHNYTPSKPKLMATCKVTVKSAPKTLTIPEALTLGKGEKYTLKPQIDEGSYGTFTYKSNNAKTASVDKNGKITAVKAGTATITVTVNNTLSKSCTVTVAKAPSKVTLSPAKATLGVGESIAFTATLPSGSVSALTASSSKTSIATVAQTEPGKFKIEAKKAGSATITVMTFNKKSAKFTVTVKKAPTAGKLTITPAQKTLAVGQSLTLKANYAKDFGGSYTWNIKDGGDMATVTDKGVVEAKAAGTVTVVATSYNGITAESKLMIEPAPDRVELPNPELKLAVKKTFTLKPVAMSGDTNVTAATFTYKSANKNIATVNSTGKITAKKAGTTTITIESYNGKTATCTVTVTKK